MGATDIALIAMLLALALYLGIKTENERARRLAAAAQDAELTRIAAADLAEQQQRDQAEAAVGRKRVACKWCDGEWYVPAEQEPPYTCPPCEHKNGY